MAWAAHGAEWASVSSAEIEAVNFDDCHDDAGRVAPLSKGLTHLEGPVRERFNEWLASFEKSKLLNEKDPGRKTRNLLALCALIDQVRGEFEAEVAYVVFERLKKDISRDDLVKTCAWVALKPAEGEVLVSAPDCGVEGTFPEEKVRTRSVLYAKKLLGRLTGKLPAK